MTTNRAAWITAPGAYPFVVKANAKPKPGPGEVVIQSMAVAVNPVDWKIQSLGRYLEKYPFILGEDTAGTIEEVGPGVSRFVKGQRVIAHCNALMTQNPTNAAFQLYPVVTEQLVSELPDFVTFEQGAVLPLAISTACAGLYRKDYLGLPLPQVENVKTTGETLLVWGGSSSVGATAIQLAVASGLTVITTASSANHNLVKSLGASAVFDYSSATIIEEIIHTLGNAKLAGVYDAISERASFEAIAAILDGLNTTVNVACVLPYDKPTKRFAPKYVLAYSIIQEPHQDIGEWIWGFYTAKALAKGTFKTKPDPLVVGNGLASIQHGLDVQKKGVSAKKVVVTI
ncbi:hypothetical protein BDV24DRAFT_170375 [Aspergillus arachidicola]|uniref:Enoyl reductase (ER) domain-containing protein n=1 Tax=Aspergillus arachidicola TaxID=656916 RepID=A0A5N6XRR7_9EURO|nr:hypothetical protein BDV24DRAFT_170375 [Aspergillus arachidicola]